MDSSINFHSVFRALPSAYLVVDPDLFIRDANDACLRNFSITKDAMMGRRLFELFLQGDDDTSAAKLQASYDEVLTKKAAVTLALLMQANSGSLDDGQASKEWYWSVTHVPVFDSTGSVVWIVTQTEAIEGASPESSDGILTSMSGGFFPASQVRSAPSAWPRPSHDAAVSPVTQNPCLNVLLVEDNEDLKETTASVIEALGHRVVAVDNAERALELLGTESFDVLFTDLSLPKTTGAELAREALNRYPTMRVIITSGYGRAMANARNLDAVFLPKPYQLVDVQNALDGTTAPNY
ncbi:MAG: response regulator [Herminiimonas sp.]|nr:response regulator [Herminiimonas sp.]